MVLWFSAGVVSYWPRSLLCLLWPFTTSLSMFVAIWPSEEDNRFYVVFFYVYLQRRQPICKKIKGEEKREVKFSPKSLACDSRHFHCLSLFKFASPFGKWAIKTLLNFMALSTHYHFLSLFWYPFTAARYLLLPFVPLAFKALWMSNSPSCFLHYVPQKL